jgi:hypothetical protein
VSKSLVPSTRGTDLAAADILTDFAQFLRQRTAAGDASRRRSAPTIPRRANSLPGTRSRASTRRLVLAENSHPFETRVSQRLGGQDPDSQRFIAPGGSSPPVSRSLTLRQRVRWNPLPKLHYSLRFTVPEIDLRSV